MENGTISQTSAIASHLSKGNSINGLQALYLYGCFRLAARISDIKSRYIVHISSKFIEDVGTGKKYANYSCDVKNQEKLQKCLTKSKTGVK